MYFQRLNLLFLLQLINQLLNASVYLELMEDNFHSTCNYLRTEDLFIWHCSDSFHVLNASSDKPVSTLKLEHQNLIRTIKPDTNDMVYLLRGSNLFASSLHSENIEDLQLKTLEHPDFNNIDTLVNIVIINDYLLFKPKDFCEIRALNIKEVELIGKESQSKVLFHDINLLHCNLDFDAKFQDQDIQYYLFFKENSTLIFSKIDIKDFSIKYQDIYGIKPSYFDRTFDDFEVHNFNNFLAIVTHARSELGSCLYVLAQSQIPIRHIYSACFADLTRISFNLQKFEKTITIHEVNKNRLRILDIQTPYPDASPWISDSITILDTDLSTNRINVFPSIYSKDVSAEKYNNLFLTYKGFQYSISDPRLFQNTHFNNLPTFALDKITCDEYLERVGDISPFSVRSNPCTLSFVHKFIEECQPKCGYQNADECHKCVAQKSNSFCFGVSHQRVCQDQHYPKVVLSKNFSFPKKTNTYNYTFELLPNTSISYFPIIANLDPIDYDLYYEIEGTLGDLSQIKMKLERHREIWGKEERTIYLNSKQSQGQLSQVRFFSFGPDKFSSLTEKIIIKIGLVESIKSCITCLTPKTFDGPNSKVGRYWRFDHGVCKLSEYNSKKGNSWEYTENWYGCMEEGYAMKDTLCEIRENQDGVIKIGFKKGNYTYTFCNVSLPFSENENLHVKFDLKEHEDIVIHYGKIFLNYRYIVNYNNEHITNDLFIENTDSINLLFLTNDPSSTVGMNREIILKYKAAKREYFGNITLAMILLILFLVILAILIWKKYLVNGFSYANKNEPYIISWFDKGNPKTLNLSPAQIRKLETIGYKTTKAIRKIQIPESSECPICLKPIMSKDYRIFLCGRHYIHTDCFKDWYSKSKSKGLCLMKCKNILISTERTARTTNIEMKLNKNSDDVRIDDLPSLEFSRNESQDSPPLKFEDEPDLRSSGNSDELDQSSPELKFGKKTKLSHWDLNFDQERERSASGVGLMKHEDPNTWDLNIDFERERNLSSVGLLKKNTSNPNFLQDEIEERRSAESEPSDIDSEEDDSPTKIENEDTKN